MVYSSKRILCSQKRKHIPYSLHTDIQWGGKRPEQSLCIVDHLCKKPTHTWLGTESCSVAYSEPLAVRAPGRGPRSWRWKRPFILNHFCILTHRKTDIITHFCLIFSNELIIRLTNYNDNF